MIELLCVIAIIAILAALLLPAVTQGQAKGRQLQCVNNLKETGVAFHAYAHDHSGRFPMEVPEREGGSLEYVQNGYRVTGEFFFSYRHFLSLSNELVTPKPLHCPAEAVRLAALDFASLRNDNLSYFVGVTATFDKPESILAGDRNITNDWTQNPSIVRNTLAYPIRWTQELHRFKGNLLFSDGHVLEAKDKAWTDNRLTANGDLFLPSQPPPGAVVSAAPSISRASIGTSAPPAMTSRPAASGSSNTGKGGSSLMTLVEARGPAPSPAPPVVAVPRTNALEPAASTNSTQPATAPADSGAPFMEFLADMADAIRLPVWLLYLLLVLILAVLATMLLRRRPR